MKSLEAIKKKLSSTTIDFYLRTDIERLVSALEKAIEQRDKMFEDISTITRKPIEEMIAEDNQELESILRGQS